MNVYGFLCYWAKKLIHEFIDFLLPVLPTSPFTQMMADFRSAMESSSVLGAVNWFMPVGSMLALGSLWLVCITTYYVYEWAMKTLKKGA